MPPLKKIMLLLFVGAMVATVNDTCIGAGLPCNSLS
ncbi:membrane protein [Salmonella enterica subsp. enterica serovar Poona]|nr:membrane protein [Salmonella enterica subsp. enterica serovar Poona]